MKSTIFPQFLFVLLSFSLTGQSKPCESHEIFTKLDFWVGKWEVKGPQGNVTGHNTITKILDNCSLLEEWTGTSGSNGKSLNFYNPQRKKWQQIWVDNSANPLFFDGEVRPDSMIYTGFSVNRNGEEIYNQMILSKVTENEVRQLWSQSKDKGKNWSVVFDGKYVREKPE